jgi:hypothetical protein
MPLDKADKSALGTAAKVTNSGVPDSDQIIEMFHMHSVFKKAN